MLSNRGIIAAREAGLLDISPWSDAALQPCSYDLSVGATYRHLGLKHTEDVRTRTGPIFGLSANRRVAAPRGSVSVATALDVVDRVAVSIPDDEDFDERAYLPAPDLAEITERLVDKHDMTIIAGDVMWCWKRKGSSKDRSCALGGQQVVSNLLALAFPGATYVAWLAADLVRELEDKSVIDALVYHHLLHLGSRDNGAPEITAHEFSGFGAEIKAYGLWSDQLKIAGHQVRQLALPMDTATSKVDDSLEGNLRRIESGVSLARHAAEVLNGGRIWGPVRQGE